MMRGPDGAKALFTHLKKVHASALPMRNRSKMQRSLLPICCWMQGVNKFAESKIFKLSEVDETGRNHACWPYSTASSGAYVMARRVAKKWLLTDIQHRLLLQWFDQQYPGRVSNIDLAKHANAGLYIDSYSLDTKGKHCEFRLREFEDYIVDQLRTIGVSLAVLLDRNLTNFILINQTRIIL